MEEASAAVAGPTASPPEVAETADGVVGKRAGAATATEGGGHDGSSISSSLKSTTAGETSASSSAVGKKMKKVGDDVEEAVRRPVVGAAKKKGGKEGGEVDEVRRGLEKVTVEDEDEEEEEERDPLADLNEDQKKTVEELKGVQEKYRDFWREYTVEWNALKAKYEEKFLPLYEQRHSILHKTGVERPDEAMKGTPALPKFWLRVFQNCRAIVSTIEPQDIPVLEYLDDISFSWEDVTKQDTFTLVFNFAKNPFFEQEIVSKRYIMSTQPGDDTPSLDKIEGTELKWYEGQDVTKRVLLRKQRNKRTKQIRVVEEPRDRQSFFHFFATREVPSDEELIEMDADEVAEFEMLFQADYDLGILIRDKIIPKAVLWFTGEEEDDDDDDEDDEDEDEDEDDDDDDDDDDDSEPDEETRRPAHNRGVHAGRQGGGGLSKRSGRRP